jgi:hypothetical protein
MHWVDQPADDPGGANHNPRLFWLCLPKDQRGSESGRLGIAREAPTDPDVQNSRIRFFGSWLCDVRGNA